MADKNFVVKNGIEVNTNLIFANNNSGKVGIGTTNPIDTLDVYGTIRTQTSNVSIGLTTNDLRVDGDISIGGSIGVSNQLIVKTGYGQTWATPNLSPRTSTVYTAEIGSTAFSVSYTIGLVDTYVNGIRLAPTEFSATTGSNVYLNDPTFGGETIEFVVYNPLF